MVITENTEPHDYLDEAIRNEDIILNDLKVIFKRINGAKENAKKGNSWETSIEDTLMFIDCLRTSLSYMELRCKDALEKQRGKK